MQIEHAGQAGLRGEVQRAGAGGYSYSGADCHDLARVDQYRLVQQHGRRQAVNEPTTTHGQRPRVGLGYHRGRSAGFGNNGTRNTPRCQCKHQCNHQQNGLEARTGQVRDFHAHPFRLAALPDSGRVCGGNGAVAIPDNARGEPCRFVKPASPSALAACCPCPDR